MIRSMTGYGDAELDTPAGRLRAEARTVNHRYFSLNLRMGRGVERWEPQVREWLRAHMPRGHVNFTLRLERPEGDAAPPATLRVNEARVREYMRLLEGLRTDLGLPGVVDLALLSRFTELVVDEDEAEAPVVEADQVRQVTEAAAAGVLVMRAEEGRRLADDLEGRLAAVEAAMEVIRQHAPQRLVTERDRMRRVVAELLDGVPVDEDRIAREIAHIAERWDVSEELVRLRAHVEMFRDTMRLDDAEPVGKRLSFLTQEMNREANTIGSKANDAAIEHQVIAIKDEIERLREQVENVE